jgi:hypothetical protein
MKRTLWDHYNAMAGTADNSREVEWGALTDTILLFVGPFFKQGQYLSDSPPDWSIRSFSLRVPRHHDSSTGTR